MDELPAHARALLNAAAHADDPTPAQRARVDAHLRAALQRSGLAELPPLVQPQRHTADRFVRLSLSKLVLLAAALIGAGGLAVVLGQRNASQKTPRPSAPVVAPTPLSIVHDIRSNEPAPAVVSGETPPPAPARPAPKSRANSGALAKSGPPTLVDDTLQQELRILASADELIRAHRFSEAVRLLGTSDSGESVLQEERSALRILAWCGLAPDERALRARKRLLQSTPQAVLAARVREACQPVADDSH